MSCVSCGTALPTGAMFCGECGRAVTGSRPAPSVRRPAPAASKPEHHAQPHDTSPPETGEACAQCGSSLEKDDVFCGECGFVVVRREPGGRDTRIIEPLDPEAPLEGWTGGWTAASSSAWAPERVEAEPDDAGPVEAEGADAEPVDAEPVSGEVSDEPGGTDDPEVSDDPEVADDPEVLDEPEPLRGARVLHETREPDEPLEPAFLFDDADHEHTRIVPRREHGERFILQFSTGESVTVFGSGLLGRNPVAEPGEYFDQYVSISDPGKSVSKTHLEFGQEAGAFWVSDRFSGNGSIVREPDLGARRCEPGKRYRMVRGSRVDIGEQFFVVS